MKSRIAASIGLETQPVAVIWSNESPQDAAQFKQGGWGCVVSMFAAAAAKGKSCVFDRATYGCWGGGVGLGFGNCYEAFPGGIEGLCRFLADGNDRTEKGRAIGKQMESSPGGRRMAEDFRHGERYLKDVGTTQRFLDVLPMQEIPKKYVVVKPLDQADAARDEIKSVTVFVNADKLSALTVLANYEAPERENVAMPWAAACQVMGILAYKELEQEHPRALVGLTDLSARLHVRAMLGSDVLSFTMPWPVFQRMEENVLGSFLQRTTWVELQQK
jgi:uncharacterized protein (DUF169 family)